MYIFPWLGLYPVFIFVYHHHHPQHETWFNFFLYVLLLLLLSSIGRCDCRQGHFFCHHTCESFFFPPSFHIQIPPTQNTRIESNIHVLSYEICAFESFEVWTESWHGYYLPEPLNHCMDMLLNTDTSHRSFPVPQCFSYTTTTLPPTAPDLSTHSRTWFTFGTRYHSQLQSWRRL